MRTSLSDVARTEEYLLGTMGTGDSLLYEAEMVINPKLKTETFLHRLIHRAVRIYHRGKIKEEIVLAGERLFNDPSRIAFKNEIMKNFNCEL